MPSTTQSGAETVKKLKLKVKVKKPDGIWGLFWGKITVVTPKGLKILQTKSPVLSSRTYDHIAWLILRNLETFYIVWTVDTKCPHVNVLISNCTQDVLGCESDSKSKLSLGRAGTSQKLFVELCIENYLGKIKNDSGKVSLRNNVWNNLIGGIN